MNILIPVDNTDYEEAQLSLLEEVKHWLFIEFEDGKIQKQEFFDKREDITEWIDVVIVKNNKEYVWPFMEENIAVLIAPFQNYVEDVMEAYLFKELHDYNEIGVNKA